MKVYVISWSPLAEDSYLKTLSYILEKWTIKETEDFESKVESLLKKLKTHKWLCPPSHKQENLRKCVISPQTSLVYRINDDTIELVAFLDNRSQHQY
ncbi:MAG: type II toxin-antitoxin system RelE/ParE family toxin [Bacteroidales bacterium]|nr:type II toxin-antitoxin system RelE/ParE family toxin [Bacteroidales bacterium]